MEWMICDVSLWSEDEYEKAFRQMSARRQRKCLALKNETDRKLCVAADFLLRRELAEKTGKSPASFRFRSTERGKPYLPEPYPKFSVSHSGTVAVCAIHDAPIGIDVEKIRPVHAGVASRICSAKEKEYLEQARDKTEKDLRFFTLWTRKEALFKLRGTGLNDDWKSDVLTRPDGIAIETERYEDYIVSVAYRVEKSRNGKEAEITEPEF